MLSPLESRYKDVLRGLALCAGQGAALSNKIRVETSYFLALADLNFFKLSPKERAFVKGLCKLSADDLELLRKLEFEGYKNIPPTRHDIKAIEYFLRVKFEKSPYQNLKGLVNWLHFALTSEDINSVAYALLIKNSVDSCLAPQLQKILRALDTLAKRYADVAMPARTHGQAAVPTTLGKELRVFYCRLKRQNDLLAHAQATCKLSGAVGNYSAHCAAFAQVNWTQFAQKFIKNFNTPKGVEIILCGASTQIDNYDSYAEIFDNLRRINTILLDAAQDIWRYISDGFLTQKAVKGETGSSTMPQKVNPIDFENAEGNLGLANALLTFFSAKLPISRLQRDLSDSTVKRNIPVAFGHCAVAYNSFLKGLSKIEADAKACLAALKKHPEIAAEGLQTILRANGVKDAYEQLKTLTRGKQVTRKELETFINKLELPQTVKNKLKNLNETNYLGLAQKIAKGEIK